MVSQARSACTEQLRDGAHDAIRTLAPYSIATEFARRGCWGTQMIIGRGKVPAYCHIGSAAPLRHLG